MQGSDLNGANMFALCFRSGKLKCAFLSSSKPDKAKLNQADLSFANFFQRIAGHDRNTECHAARSQVQQRQPILTKLRSTQINPAQLSQAAAMESPTIPNTRWYK